MPTDKEVNEIISDLQKMLNSLQVELDVLRKENARLFEEIKVPRCHSCHSVLGDNWCADCAGKAGK